MTNVVLIIIGVLILASCDVNGDDATSFTFAGCQWNIPNTYSRAGDIGARTFHFSRLTEDLSAEGAVYFERLEGKVEMVGKITDLVKVL